MTRKQHKKLLLSLIKDDLINSKLIRGLNNAGLEATQYCLFLSGTIFDLMGYGSSEREEEIFSQYVQLTKKGDSIDIHETPNALDELAKEIYHFLVKRKPRRK